MNRRLLACLFWGLLITGLSLAAAWTYHDGQPRAEAWTIDRTEQIVSRFTLDQEFSTSFHLTNTSHRPLRILGASAC